jgi:hypothetical protein
MNPRAITRGAFCIAGTLLLAAIACSKPSRPDAGGPTSPSERLVKSATPPPLSVVHKTFTLPKYESYNFEVPPHCLRPRLHGNFKAYRYGEKGNRASDEASSIDLFLFDEQQYNDFVNGPSDTTTRSVQAAYEQDVDWALRSTFEQPAKYYLVFNNSSGKSKTKVVDADFTLSFD